MVTKPEAIQLYSNARVFCCPSVYEPFGIINLEAMACRAPVVASATGGIKEVVVDGETGYLVPFDQDPETSFPTHPEQFARDLASRIHQLLGDPPALRRCGKKARGRHLQLDGNRPPDRGTLPELNRAEKKRSVEFGRDDSRELLKIPRFEIPRRFELPRRFERARLQSCRKYRKINVGFSP
jgi:glycosyltransferase involved in cell wall biosynthesis